MSDFSDIVDSFRARLETLQVKSGLKDKPFAEKIGINYKTYRNIMGRDPKRASLQGPTLVTIGALIAQLGINDVLWLLTGKRGLEVDRLPAAVREPEIEWDSSPHVEEEMESVAWEDVEDALSELKSDMGPKGRALLAEELVEGCRTLRRYLRHRSEEAAAAKKTA